MFKVFNPLTGIYSEELEESAAKKLWITLIQEVTNSFQIKPSIVGRFAYKTEWANNFDIAWKFYCEKLNIEYYDLLAIEKPSYPKLCASHSVFNTETRTKRSDTFMYLDDMQRMRHIKVHDGIVTDWYCYQYVLDDKLFEWVSFDTKTGTPIEVYERQDEVTLVKRNLNNPDAPKVTTKLMPFSQMPIEVQEAVGDFEHKDSIYAYSYKDYGLIVEYYDNPEVDFSEWPDDKLFEYKNLQEQNLFEARQKAVELVHVVSITKDSNGYETWTSADFKF